MVDCDTKVVATRVSHDRLAHSQFPQANDDTARYAMLKSGTSAIHMHYRGPQVQDDGRVPAGGMITFYLVMAERHQQADAA